MTGNLRWLSVKVHNMNFRSEHNGFGGAGEMALFSAVVAQQCSAMVEAANAVMSARFAEQCQNSQPKTLSYRY
jgi:hypothetical protein